MQCYKCRQLLIGKPKIEIEGQPYCYKCAKSEVKNRDIAAITNSFTEFDQKKKDYLQRKQIFYDQHNVWRNKRDAHCKLGRLGCVAGIVLATALGIVASLFSLKLIWVGLIVAFISYLIGSIHIEGRRHAQFIIENPEPIFSDDAPIFDFGTDRVKHRPLETDGTPLSKNYREEILKRDNNTCQNCGKKKQRRFLEVHHIIPRSKGGKDDPTNLITLC